MEKNIDIQLIGSEPYINMRDLADWITAIRDHYKNDDKQLEALNMIATTLLTEYQNLTNKASLESTKIQGIQNL